MHKNPSDNHQYTGPIKAFVFDWAGTIVDYGSRAPASVFVDVFAGEGVAISLAEARGPMGTAKRDHIAALVGHPDIAARWRKAKGADPTDRDIDRMYDAFLPRQMAALANHSDVIPGTLELLAAARKRGIKIGSSTGYVASLMEVVIPAAKQRGLEVDAMVCTTDVPAGRPAPWMIFENAQRLGVYPMASIVTVDDTTVGIEAARAAGTWAVAVTKTGNEIGLGPDEVAAMPAAELAKKLDAGRDRFFKAGAHYVIDGVADLMGVVDDIERRLAAGGRP